MSGRAAEVAKTAQQWSRREVLSSSQFCLSQVTSGLPTTSQLIQPHRKSNGRNSMSCSRNVAKLCNPNFSRYACLTRF